MTDGDLGDYAVVADELRSTTGIESLPKQRVGETGIHRHENPTNLHQGEVVGCLAVSSLRRRGQQHRILRPEELRQAPGVGDVDQLLLPIVTHYRREPVLPGNKRCVLEIRIQSQLGSSREVMLASALAGHNLLGRGRTLTLL